MTPDFSAPAFEFTALCGIRFRTRMESGRSGPFRSDYRCQLHFLDEFNETEDVEARIYFVGQEIASPGDEVAAVVAFLDWEKQRDRCRVGTNFELGEGSVVTATGVVHATASRSHR